MEADNKEVLGINTPEIPYFKVDAFAKVMAHLDQDELTAIGEAVVERVLNRIQQFEVLTGNLWIKVIKGYVLPNGYLQYQVTENDPLRLVCDPRYWRPVQ